MADIKNDTAVFQEIDKYLVILSKSPASMVFAPLAEAYRKAGMLDEAISTATEGLKHHPNYVSGMVVLGRSFFEKGRYAEARDTLLKVLAIAPDNIMAANVLEEIKKKPEEKVYGHTFTPNLSAPLVSEKPSASEAVWLGAEDEEAIAEIEELEEIEEISEADEIVVDEPVADDLGAAELDETMGLESESATPFGEEITEELWTGETTAEEVKVDENQEDIRPKKGITTNTIAELYIKQGYIDKAVDIYQTLYDANPFDEDIKRKLEELKQQLEGVSGAGEEPVVSEELQAERIEPAVKAPEVTSGREVDVASAGMKSETLVDENVKNLESWLRSIQSERRKVDGI